MEGVAGDADCQESIYGFRGCGLFFLVWVVRDGETANLTSKPCCYSGVALSAVTKAREKIQGLPPPIRVFETVARTLGSCGGGKEGRMIFFGVGLARVFWVSGTAARGESVPPR